MRAQNTLVARTAVSCMTFNVRYGTADDGANRWEKRRDLVFSVIKNNAPDILCLQEALRFQLNEIERELPGYSELGVGRDDGSTQGEYAAILYSASRYVVAECGTFWFSDTPEKVASKSWGNNVTRICTWARLIDKNTRRPLYVYNLHLDHESQNSRERSTGLLAERIASRRYPDPYIVAGDFNCGAENPAIRFLLNPGSTAFIPVKDSYFMKHPDATGTGTYHAFTGNAEKEKIDLILVSPEWLVLDAKIDRTSTNGRYPSDHFPVTAVVSAQ